MTRERANPRAATLCQLSSQSPTGETRVLDAAASSRAPRMATNLCRRNPRRGSGTGRQTRTPGQPETVIRLELSTVPNLYGHGLRYGTKTTLQSTWTVSILRTRMKELRTVNHNRLMYRTTEHDTTTKRFATEMREQSSGSTAAVHGRRRHRWPQVPPPTPPLAASRQRVAPVLTSMPVRGRQRPPTEPDTTTEREWPLRRQSGGIAAATVFRRRRRVQLAAAPRQAVQGPASIPPPPPSASHAVTDNAAPPTLRSTTCRSGACRRGWARAVPLTPPQSRHPPRPCRPHACRRQDGGLTTAAMTVRKDRRRRRRQRRRAGGRRRRRGALDGGGEHGGRDVRGVPARILGGVYVEGSNGGADARREDRAVDGYVDREVQGGGGARRRPPPPPATRRAAPAGIAAVVSAWPTRRPGRLVTDPPPPWPTAPPPSRAPPVLAACDAGVRSPTLNVALESAPPPPPSSSHNPSSNLNLGGGKEHPVPHGEARPAVACHQSPFRNRAATDTASDDYPSVPSTGKPLTIRTVTAQATAGKVGGAEARASASGAPVVVGTAGAASAEKSGGDGRG